MLISKYLEGLYYDGQTDTLYEYITVVFDDSQGVQDCFMICEALHLGELVADLTVSNPAGMFYIGKV